MVDVLVEGDGTELGPEAGDPDGFVAGLEALGELVLVGLPDEGVLELGVPLGVEKLLGVGDVELGLGLVVEELWDSNCCS